MTKELSKEELAILKILREVEDMLNITEIKNQLGYSHTRASKYVQLLAVRGLVEEKKLASAKYYLLTDTGKKFLNEHS